MALKFFDFLRPKNEGRGKTAEIQCAELMAAAQEYKVRELCFWICVNMIANAVGRCEFRTFRNGAEIRERDYYLWNIEPNINQNSTMFLHKLVAKLCMDNEALVINPSSQSGHDALVVADGWDKPETRITKMSEYKGVYVDDFTFTKTFREDDVMHLKLNHINITPVLDGISQSYSNLLNASMKAYQWAQGQHWKVHVDQVPSGAKDFESTFAQMIQEQVKPFLESNGAILPEFEGYTYTNEGKDVGKDTRDIKAQVEDIFDFTARAFLIPAVLVNGKVEATSDANNRFLTYVIDPICDQLQEEINRKFYGYDRWKAGEYLQVDTSSIIHFDLFANAANVEKLVGSGAFNINDIRRAAGQAPIDEPWANMFFMTKNIATMDEATRPMTGQGGENK